MQELERLRVENEQLLATQDTLFNLKTQVEQMEQQRQQLAAITEEKERLVREVEDWKEKAQKLEQATTNQVRAFLSPLSSLLSPLTLNTM